MRILISFSGKFTVILLLHFISFHQSLNFILDPLSQSNLSTLNYDEIHELIIRNQVENFSPPLKSLHTRNVKPLDGSYDFCLDPDERGFTENWYSAHLRSKCKDENFYRMPVPAAINDVTSDKRIRNYMGWFWYQTVVSSTSKDICEKKSFIQFDNVNYLALVWVQKLTPNATGDEHQDASLVGSHVGGFLPFLVDVTDLELTVFRLTIAVSNKLTRDTIPSGHLDDLSEVVGRKYLKFRPDFDFFHYAGIMGSIHLIHLPEVYLSSVEHIRLMDTSHIYLNVCLNKVYQEDRSPSVSVLLVSAERDFYEQYEFVLVRKRCKTLRIELSSSWPNFTLADGNPNHFSSFFTLQLKLTSTGYKHEDIYELRLTSRSSVRLDLTKGLIVNGSRRQLQGFGMHQEQLFSGRSMSQASIMKDIYLLKKMGANVVRTSHYPYSSDYLDACDENGILVIAECAAVGLNSFSGIKLILHKQLLFEMMQLHHQHPSIVAWSVANEPSSQLPEAEMYFESLLEYARTDLAPYTVASGRPLTGAIAQEASVDLVSKTLDMIMVNVYFGWYDYTAVPEAVRSSVLKSLATWSRRQPGKALLVSEFGAGSLAGMHSCESTIFSEEYQRDLLLEHERVFDEIFQLSTSINFIGSMVWNFADFSVHDSLLRPGGNRKGVFTRDRSPKLVVESLRAFYLSRLNEQDERRNNCSL